LNTQFLSNVHKGLSRLNKYGKIKQYDFRICVDGS
jgi:hypothetical protein